MCDNQCEEGAKCSEQGGARQGGGVGGVGGGDPTLPAHIPIRGPGPITDW